MTDRPPRRSQSGDAPPEAHTAIRLTADRKIPTANLGQIDLVIPTDNADALAAALRKLAADPERVKRQGAAARQLTVSFYNWHRATKDTLDAMQAILDQKENGTGKVQVTPVGST